MMTKQYTFKSSNSTEITVAASSEAEARTLAMTKLHGPAPQRIGMPPCEIGRGGWTGAGLSLVEEEQSDAL